VAADATRVIGRPDSFDTVLVDAPCSGLGTLRQHPEIRWRRSPGDLAELARVQGALLRCAAEAVRPGGMLVYSTCTIVRQENEVVVEGFLAERSDFALEDAAPWLPEAARGFVGTDGCLRTAPHRGGLDGFFAARLKRCEPRRIVGG
jgi:16S rRNA (cytosine967-C5)-methyltransferase